MDDLDSRVWFLMGAGNISLHHHIQNGSGSTQPSSQWVPGALSLGVKQLGSEANHSPPSSAEVKECMELFLHSSNMPSWRGTQLKKKHRDNFTFTFTFYICTLQIHNFSWLIPAWYHMGTHSHCTA
jgi:hypothetical protein